CAELARTRARYRTRSSGGVDAVRSWNASVDRAGYERKRRRADRSDDHDRTRTGPARHGGTHADGDAKRGERGKRIARREGSRIHPRGDRRWWSRHDAQWFARTGKLGSPE